MAPTACAACAAQRLSVRLCSECIAQSSGVQCEHGLWRQGPCATSLWPWEAGAGGELAGFTS